MRNSHSSTWSRAALFLLLAGGAGGLSGAERPNILFILTDDQSYRSVSGYEGARPWVATPHLDALARGGVRFKSAYVGTWCMPARVSLLTGRLPHAVDAAHP